MKDTKNKTLNLQKSITGMSRRNFMKNLGITAASVALMPNTVFATTTNKNNETTARFVYVGTYSAPNFAPGGKVTSTAEGIYVYKMEKNGNLLPIQVVKADNPSFVTVDPTMNYLYSVNELGSDNEGKPLGRVSSYKIDQASGKLSLINSELTNGTWPCHCHVHFSGKFLLAANYGSGNFPVYPINEDGSIGKMTDLMQSSGNGTGPDQARQGGPHAHMILNNPGGQHVFGVDLGADKVLSWDLDMASGKLIPSTVPFANTASGGGPRHMDFHPNDQFAYILNELSSTIDVFSFDPIRGSFSWVQNVSTLPSDTKYVRPIFDPTNPGKVPTGTNTTAEIRIHPSGKWLYSTNRGMNSIAMFEVNPILGKLVATGWVSTQGDIPRGMSMDPSGSFLLVGNQNSDTILVFSINSQNGDLAKPLHQINSPVPVDFAFGPTA
jgi:6-phosphogluconolactonase